MYFSVNLLRNHTVWPSFYFFKFTIFLVSVRKFKDHGKFLNIIYIFWLSIFCLHCPVQGPDSFPSTTDMCRLSASETGKKITCWTISQFRISLYFSVPNFFFPFFFPSFFIPSFFPFFLFLFFSLLEVLAFPRFLLFLQMASISHSCGFFLW